jgi:hypothetical protein
MPLSQREWNALPHRKLKYLTRRYLRLIPAQQFQDREDHPYVEHRDSHGYYLGRSGGPRFVTRTINKGRRWLLKTWNGKHLLTGRKCTGPSNPVVDGQEIEWHNYTRPQEHLLYTERETPMWKMVKEKLTLSGTHCQRLKRRRRGQHKSTHKRCKLEALRGQTDYS